MFERSVWLLYIRGKHSCLAELGNYKQSEFDAFRDYVTRSDGKLNGQEQEFLNKVPCAWDIVLGLWQATAAYCEEDVFSATA